MEATTTEVQELKERLKSYLDFLEEPQLKCFEMVLNMGNQPFNKHTMVKFIKESNLNPDEINQTIGQDEILSNYDTAYPVNYIREIEKVYPDINKGNYIYDYSNLSFGRLVNLNNGFVTALYKLMNS